MGICIILCCDDSQLEKWRAWCKDNDIDEEGGECVTGEITQGSAVMDYYFRLVCIAAYRRTKSSTKVISMTGNKSPPQLLLITSKPKDRRTVHDLAEELPGIHEGRDLEDAVEDLSTGLEHHGSQPTRPGQPEPSQDDEHGIWWLSRFVNTAHCLLSIPEL